MKKIDFFYIVLTLIVCVALYLVTCKFIYGVGFPLDDAWIHQTYARNLILFGDWEYLPGKISAGSTSPLWTLMIATGYLLRISPLIWTFFLGVLCLCMSGIVGQLLYRKLIGNLTYFLPIGGMFIAGEWHIVWAAISGMETGLFILLILLFFLVLSENYPNWIFVGILIGFAVWVRPDGLTLIGPTLFVIWTKYPSLKEKINNTLFVIPGIILIVGGYAFFNYQLSGSIFPNTFYAKQFEYTDGIQSPLWQRYFLLLQQPFIGAGFLLLPGFLYQVYDSIIKKNWWVISAIIWVVGYLLLYSIFLPVSYQHGRYQMPVMPLIFLISLAGCYELITIYLKSIKFRLFKQVWVMSIFFVWVLFNILGARAYANDVAIIETEMVQSSKWISTNTNKNSIIAAHDIGALGYFGKREIVDLAGLITPSIIDIMRDEDKLGYFLSQQKIDYLMTFPSWYPKLVKTGEIVYKTDSSFSPLVGGENMEVIRLHEK